MRRFCCVALLICLGGLFPACGKKGPILPPLEKKPKPVEALSALQRGQEVILRWRLPDSYVDGGPIEGIAAVELWRLTDKKLEDGTFSALDASRFEREARPMVTIEEKEYPKYLTEVSGAEPEFVFSHGFEAEDIGGTRWAYAIRVQDTRGEYSEFSKLAAIEARLVAHPPSDLQGRVWKYRIELSWKPPDKNVDGTSSPIVKGYHIYRSSGDEKPLRINRALLPDVGFADRTFDFGRKYRYIVRAAMTDAPPFLESADSVPYEIEPLDTFPPEVPEGLQVIAGTDYVSLSWDPGTDRDLDVYLVWRREAGSSADFRLMTVAGIRENAYTDNQVRRNRAYEYCVSAKDLAGNESPKSQPVSVRLRRGKDEDLPL